MMGTGECVHVLIHQTSAMSAVLIIGTLDIEVWRMVIGDLNGAAVMEQSA